MQYQTTFFSSTKDYGFCWIGNDRQPQIAVFIKMEKIFFGMLVLLSHNGEIAEYK